MGEDKEGVKIKFVSSAIEGYCIILIRTVCTSKILEQLANSVDDRKPPKHI